MSGFLGKIASAFVEIEKEPEQQAVNNPVAAPAQKSVPPQVSAPIVNGNVTPQAAMQVNQLDEALVNKLCARLEQSQTSKPDYLEFKQSMTDETMISSIPAEDARMKIVFKVLSAGSSSFSKQVLIQSIDRYLEMLARWQGEMNKEVSDGMKEIAAKQARVEELREQIEKLNIEAETINNEITVLSEKYESKKCAFENAVAYINKEFSDDRQKINTIL